MAVMSYGWEGNRRSAIALDMYHIHRKFKWLIHLRAHGLRKGHDLPAYTPLMGMEPFI